jgi:predicted nuclease of predicted toxin-antitoxin system
MSDRPTFYVDRCLGKAVPKALQDAGARVERHDDHFAQNALDEDWIPEVSRRGWVILTKDKNIRRTAGEREAALTSKARIFTLSSGNMQGQVMAALFVSRLADMEKMANEHPPLFVAVVSPVDIRVVIPRTVSPGEGGGEGKESE